MLLIVPFCLLFYCVGHAGAVITVKQEVTIITRCLTGHSQLCTFNILAQVNTVIDELNKAFTAKLLIVLFFFAFIRYMKGRLTYQQVNTVIDELNKAFTAKYKLLRQKKSTLNDRNRKRYETLKMQESKDTKGGGVFSLESVPHNWQWWAGGRLIWVEIQREGWVGKRGSLLS